MSEMRLFNADGNRLYLTQSERQTFLDTARLERPEIRTFAETLAYKGCRISEALELVPKRVALDECRIVLRSLKKRREDVYSILILSIWFIVSGKRRNPEKRPINAYGRERDSM